MAKKIISVLIKLLAFLFLLPIIYTMLLSVSNIAIDNLHLQLPTQMTLDHYYSMIFFKNVFFDFFKKSVVMTLIIIMGQIVIGIFAAYAFAKLEFSGKKILFFLYVLILLLPFQVTMVPNYFFFSAIEKFLHFKILDTSLALILPGIFYSFGVFLMRQFILDIPDELIDAAKMDGASDIRILFSIVIPMIKQGVVALIVLTFIDYWNIIEQAVIFIDTPEKQPLSVYLNNVYQGESIGIYAAAATLYMIPAIWVIVKGQNALMEASSKERQS